MPYRPEERVLALEHGNAPLLRPEPDLGARVHGDDGFGQRLGDDCALAVVSGEAQNGAPGVVGGEREQRGAPIGQPEFDERVLCAAAEPEERVSHTGVGRAQRSGSDVQEGHGLLLAVSGARLLWRRDDLNGGTVCHRHEYARVYMPSPPKSIVVQAYNVFL